MNNGRHWIGKTVRETFDSRYTVEDNGCWIWKAIKNPKRYPAMLGAFKGKKIRCSVFAWERKHGQKIPEGMHMLHTCDRPNCVNPDHAFPGTPAQNIADMVEKGRHADLKGEQMPAHKLTETQVIEIRYLAAARSPHKSIAKQYGIHVVTVSQICTGKAWAHLPL